MVTPRRINLLHVLMNDEQIGLLQRMTGGGLQFHYTENWLDKPDARPLSLSLPLTSKPYVDDRVQNFFDNLLPDNPKIRARIQARFQLPSNRPFDLLTAIGRDCIGAIQLCDEIQPPIPQIQAAPVSNQDIANVLRNYHDAPLGMQRDVDDFRISLAGAQEKSAFLYQQKRWYRPLHTTPSTHIFKLPIGKLPHQQIDLSNSCENEWLCARIAHAYDLPVANSEILHFDDIKVLVTQRFDRRWSADHKHIWRLPQEDMCQALGYSPNLKYQSDGGPDINAIMKLLLGSRRATQDRQSFFKAQILFWLLAAIDGHAKNFSLFIQPYGRYHTTPLYDILSAHPLIADKQLQRQKIKMAMALKGSSNHYHWHSIQRRHFLSAASAANYSANIVDTLLNDMLAQLDTVITSVTAILPQNFPSAIAEPTFNGMRQLRDRLASQK